MESDRWKKEKEILEDALRKGAGEREEYVRGACGGDEGMCREVMSLLASADEMDDFIEAPYFQRGPEPSDDDAIERDRIGSFKLLRSLGRGGMGVVYLAARADEEFEQQVAVKLIKRGMDSDEIISRFRHERQILAQLVHPNIARLLDGGTTEDGLPYFVMEHVDGEPIRRYCEARDLSTAERLVLFRKVCAAVQFAHQNLIVHRDLKPGNILVTAGGEPKLLDFGIAKLLTPDGAQITRQSGKRPVTPEYASPEQLRGKAVTTVSDVFSLGVLLYELLTETQPFYRKGTGDGDSWPGSRPEPPDKPSSVVRRPAERERSTKEQGRDLRRRLAGDLDHIVLKAMRHEPEKRYSSVEQLSEDIARHLEGRPVLARRGAWGYRLGKAFRRHWGKLAIATVLVALIGSLSFGAVQYQRVDRQYTRAEAIADFMFDIISGSDPNQPLTRRQILDRATESVPESLRDYPAEKAAFFGMMGQAYRQIGLLDKAQESLEESLRIRPEFFGRDHRLVAKSLNSLALVLREKEDFVAAEAMMREALAIMRKYIRHDDLEIVRVLGNHAGLLRELGEFEAAINEYREALAMMRRLAGDDDHKDIARAQNNLGSCLREVGQMKESEALHREAVAMARRLYEPGHRIIAVYLNNLAKVLRDQGKLAEAKPMFRESLAIRRAVHVEKPWKITIALRDLALCVQLQGKYEEAEALYREALTIHLEKPLGRQLKLAITLRELATLQTAQGDNTAAEASAREALEIFRAGLPEGHWRIADAESVLGGALAGLGRVEEAKPLLDRGAEVVTGIKGDAARESREARRRPEALNGESNDGY